MFLCGSVLIHTRNDAQRGEEGGGHGRWSRKAEWGRAWSALHCLDRRVGGRERGPLRRPLGARAAEQVFDSPRRASRGNQAAAAHTTRTPAETGRERLAVLDGASKLHHDAANPPPTPHPRRIHQKCYGIDGGRWSLDGIGEPDAGGAARHHRTAAEQNPFRARALRVRVVA